MMRSVRHREVVRRAMADGWIGPQLLFAKSVTSVLSPVRILTAFFIFLPARQWLGLADSVIFHPARLVQRTVDKQRAVIGIIINRARKCFRSTGRSVLRIGLPFHRTIERSRCVDFPVASARLAPEHPPRNFIQVIGWEGLISTVTRPSRRPCPVFFLCLVLDSFFDFFIMDGDFGPCEPGCLRSAWITGGAGRLVRVISIDDHWRHGDGWTRRGLSRLSNKEAAV